jgi:hypothetical protein
MGVSKTDTVERIPMSSGGVPAPEPQECRPFAPEAVALPPVEHRMKACSADETKASLRRTKTVVALPMLFGS